MNQMCSVAGCQSAVYDSGYCSRHANKWRKYGDPLAGRTNASPRTGHLMANGYVRRMVDYETQFEHIRVAERALGRKIPKGAVVHHVDGNRSNNAPKNLVICQDSAYHMLLHKRTDALSASGHPDWRKCRFCKQYDSTDNLKITPTNVHHRECINAYYRNQRKEKS